METGSMAAALLRARTAAGLSQRALAARVGVRQATVVAWESGASLPDTARLAALCEALGLTATYRPSRGWTVV